MALEFRLLGPLEVLVDGTPARLGGPRQRALLALLLVHANEVVPVARLVDEVWGDDPPVTAGNVLQTYVSQLRKALGRDAIGTRGRGYVVAVPDGALDLRRFERHASAGAQARADGRSGDAAAEFRAALALWRGAALSDLAGEPCARRSRRAWTGCDCWLSSARSRLTSPAAATRSSSPSSTRWSPPTRCTSASGRCRCWPSTAPAVRPMRSRPTASLARPWSPSSASSPGPPCATCERGILEQDPALAAPRAPSPSPHSAPIAADPRRVMAAAFALASLPSLAALGESLAGGSQRELVIATSVANVAELDGAIGRLAELCEELRGRGVTARSAAFTSLTPGAT